jgi:hypothetical protein
LGSSISLKAFSNCLNCSGTSPITGPQSRSTAGSFSNWYIRNTNASIQQLWDTLGKNGIASGRPGLSFCVLRGCACIPDGGGTEKYACCSLSFDEEAVDAELNGTSGARTHSQLVWAVGCSSVTLDQDPGSFSHTGSTGRVSPANQAGTGIGCSTIRLLETNLLGRPGLGSFIATLPALNGQ